MLAPDRVAMPLRPGDKRKHDGTPSGLAKRFRARRDAREIMSQPGTAALSNGALNIPAFVKSQAFAIEALERSMKASKASRTQRAFQRVPRNMRRRTASHNPKRVPKRLRRRAIREMEEDNTPVVTSRRRKPRTTRARIRVETAKRLGILAKKRRRRKAYTKKQQKAKGLDGEGDVTMGEDTAAAAQDKPQKRRVKIRKNVLNHPRVPERSKYSMRQRNKTWLPTHVWHAKRARMSDPKKPLWGYAIPMRPNEKMFRATHRALSNIGSLAWDTTYMSTIGVYGRFPNVELVLKKLGLVSEGLWNDRGIRWRQGLRSWSGILSREEDDMRLEICPATVLWGNQEHLHSADHAAVFIRLHPAAFPEVFKDLLGYVKQETNKVYIEDLRFDIGSIDITGPAAMETLLAIMKPHPHTNIRPSNVPHASVFEKLRNLTNAGALPNGALLHFTIVDPRLSYPPRKVTFKQSDNETLMNTLENWNTFVQPGATDLFSRKWRNMAFFLPTKKDIDLRRSKHTPGAPLPIIFKDYPIPIILLAHRSPAGSRATGSFTLLLPWPCVQPVWYSLVHVPLSSGGNPKFGGLQEMAQMYDERSMPWFPRDFPATAAGAEWERKSKEEKETLWRKRPKGKRTTWSSVKLGAGRKGEIGNPYACDYQMLFPEVPEGSFAMTSMRQLDPSTLNKAYSAMSMESLKQILPPLAILRIRITFFSQGIAHPIARVYRLPTAARGPATTPLISSTTNAIEIPVSQPTEEETLPADLRAQWIALTHKSAKPAANGGCRTLWVPPGKSPLEQKAHIATSLLTNSGKIPTEEKILYKYDIHGHPMCPARSDLVGFVTSGGYSLEAGKATAIATVSAEGILRDLVAGRKGREGGRWRGAANLCVIRNSGAEVGWVARWEVI